jgi:hypothetical protein
MKNPKSEYRMTKETLSTNDQESRRREGFLSGFVIRHLSFALVQLLTLIGSATLYAQPYSIDWFTIDGGGGVSSNSQPSTINYQLSGTIGQPDAGKLSGGSYTLDGGFWGILAAVQSPGAPLLTIRLTATNTVAISWPSPSTGFNLQQNTNGIATVNWSSVTTTPIDDGTTKTVIVDPPTGNRFYRLKYP